MKKRIILKKFFIVFAVAVVLFSGLTIFKNEIIKSTLCAHATAVADVPVRIESVSFGITTQTIKIKGLKIYNPEGFPEEVFIDIPLIKASYDLGALLKRKLHIKTLEINIKEMVLIKNSQQQYNVDSLKMVQADNASPAKENDAADDKRPVQIDLLHWNLDKIIYKNFGVKKDSPAEIFDLDIKGRTYKNITNVQQLIVLIVAGSLKETGIKKLSIFETANGLGLGLLPTSIAFTLVGRDNIQENIQVETHILYAVTVNVLNKIGKVKKENMDQGRIFASVDGSTIVVTIEKTAKTWSQIIVSARKLLLHEVRTAEKVLYHIKKELQQKSQKSGPRPNMTINLKDTL